MQRNYSVLFSLLALFLYAGQSQCDAQTVPAGPVQGSLVTLINSGQYNFNALERLSAIANQASYNALTNGAAGGAHCDPTQVNPSTTCAGPIFFLFSNLRKLVETANALLANGQPTRYSLNLSDQKLGRALRWTAAEELSAPGSTSTEFTNAQFASVASRITALRMGATGFSVAGIDGQSTGGDALVAMGPLPRGGGASADSTDFGGASRWGGFFNGAFGWGNRDPTTLEDAFGFHTRDATLGVDYRFNRRLVLGAAAGYTNQRIDFDPTLSVVGGDIHSDGYSFQFFALYEWDGPYATISVGAQRESYSSTRLIQYPSLNSEVSAVNAVANGSTNSKTVTGTFELGWSLSHKALAIEPYLRGEYQHITLEGFHESSVNVGGPDAGAPSGFDFDYAPQHISVLDSVLGTRFQYAFSPRFGVAVPYFRAEYHHLFDNNPGTVVSSYNAIVNTGVAFNIPSERPDANFLQFAIGSSFVFGHGIQAFLQYQTSVGIANVSTHLVSAGFRGAF